MRSRSPHSDPEQKGIEETRHYMRVEQGRIATARLSRCRTVESDQRIPAGRRWGQLFRTLRTVRNRKWSTGECENSILQSAITGSLLRD